VKQKKFSIALLAQLLITGGALAPAQVTAQGIGGNVPVVTLAEARRRAEGVAPAVSVARNQTATAVWEKRAAWAGLFTPSVNAGMSYLHFSQPFFNFGTGAISSSSTNATLDASYVILGGSKFADVRRSRALLESAEANETAIRYQTSYQTDVAYYAVLADQDLARVAADRLKRAEQQLSLARARVSAGDAIATDSLQLLLEANRARLAVTQSDSAMAVSQLRLGRLIGLSGPAQAATVETGTPRDLPLSLDQAIDEMATRGPQIEAARANERRATAVVGSERAAYLPKLTLGATTGAYDATLFPTATHRTQFGVTASLPIWNGGQRELSIARARADRSIATATRKDTELAAAELMTAAYQGYRTARAGIELAQVGVVVATENYRVQHARYTEGATTILDMLEAQTALTEAEATLVQSRYSSRLALAEIEALLGRRLFVIQDGATAIPPR
jgi:outer membrane protein TolC